MLIGGRISGYIWNFRGFDGYSIDEYYLEENWAQTTKFMIVSRRDALVWKLPATSIALCIPDGRYGMAVAR